MTRWKNLLSVYQDVVGGNTRWTPRDFQSWLFVELQIFNYHPELLCFQAFAFEGRGRCQVCVSIVVINYLMYLLLYTGILDRKLAGLHKYKGWFEIVSFPTLLLGSNARQTDVKGNVHDWSIKVQSMALSAVRRGWWRWWRWWSCRKACFLSPTCTFMGSWGVKVGQ